MKGGNLQNGHLSIECFLVFFWNVWVSFKSKSTLFCASSSFFSNFLQREREREREGGICGSHACHGGSVWRRDNRLNILAPAEHQSNNNNNNNKSEKYFVNFEKKKTNVVNITTGKSTTPSCFWFIWIIVSNMWLLKSVNGITATDWISCGATHKRKCFFFFKLHANDKMKRAFRPNPVSRRNSREATTFATLATWIVFHFFFFFVGSWWGGKRVFFLVNHLWLNRNIKQCQTQAPDFSNEKLASWAIAARYHHQRFVWVWEEGRGVR